jgi:hypothetical protein
MRYRRNADEIPSDMLLPVAPISPPILRTQPTQAMIPWGPMPARPRPSRANRAAQAVRRKASEIYDAVKPETATLDKEHVWGVLANAGGAGATALATNEVVDNFGPMPTAIGAALLGGAGSLWLKGNWQKAAQGVLGAGVGQIGVAYLTDRALKKARAAERAAKALAAPAPAPAPAAATSSGTPPSGARNAYVGDDDGMLRALDRVERRLNEMLGDERNAYDAGLDGDYIDAYGYAA